jgi:hypothetical protein
MLDVTITGNTPHADSFLERYFHSGRRHSGVDGRRREKGEEGSGKAGSAAAEGLPEITDDAGLGVR